MGKQVSDLEGAENEEKIKILDLCKNYLKLIRTKELIFLGLVSFFAYIPSITFTDLWGISYLQNVQSYSGYQSALVISLIYTGWLIGSIINGWLVDMIGGAKKVVLTGLIVALLAMCAIIYLDLPYFIVCILAVITGVANSVQILCFSLVAKVAHKNYVASAASIVNFMTMFSGIIFQGVVGVILTYTGSYQITFILVPVAFMCSFIVALKLFTWIK